MSEPDPIAADEYGAVQLDDTEAIEREAQTGANAAARAADAMLEEFAAQPLEDGDQVAPIPARAKSARPAMPKPEATADALEVEVEVEPSTVMDEVQRRRPLIEQLVRDGRRLRAAGLYGADVLIRHAREADIDLPRELVRDIADAIADPYGIPNEPLAGVKPDGGEDGDE